KSERDADDKNDDLLSEGLFRLRYCNQPVPTVDRRLPQPLHENSPAPMFDRGQNRRPEIQSLFMCLLRMCIRLLHEGGGHVQPQRQGGAGDWRFQWPWYSVRQSTGGQWRDGCAGGAAG